LLSGMAPPTGRYQPRTKAHRRHAQNDTAHITAMRCLSVTCGCTSPIPEVTFQ